ncbi:transcriptional regulator [Moraxella caviae]|uniref:Helix-turn-helix domain n=1 Tax=Moraxella caviae TaxID=34060 RepID=A0A1T0A5C7_9GAMM|nr:helix-turn-helix transcriptional regulator [Moraxella caviae]OOR90924.1 transcriptional regulator [Moraxella caviae]STZ10188.1 Helix-turn-helix domain [Moraxella caviae]
MTAHTANIFAQRLKLARKARKLSQEKLGILSGIDPSSASARMNQYERGKHTPDFLTLSKIAHTLELPIAYFYAENDDLADLIRHFHRSDDVQKLELLTFINQQKTQPT